MQCRNCGREIKFIKHKGKNIPVGIGTVLVRLDEHDPTARSYLMANGSFVKGVVDVDGIECYIVHKCIQTTKQPKKQNKVEQISLFGA